LIYLAQMQGEGPIQIRKIAEDLDISRKFLEAILLELRNDGILKSRMGKEGGYFLERAPDTITMSRIIRLIDGMLAAVPCVSQTAYAQCDDCPNEKDCAIRWVMKDVRDSTASILDKTTLDQLVHKTKHLGDLSGLEYQI